jgi:AhpC/TSA antioxidant enzyme
MRFLIAFILFFGLFITNIASYSLLDGVMVKRITTAATTTSTSRNKNSDEIIDVGQYIQDTNDKCMIIFGTYAADFNAIEYGQRLRYYWPILQQTKGIKKCCLILNCQKDAAIAYKKYINIPDSIDVCIDNTGIAGKRFGVGLGWLPNNTELNPFIKLFGMLFGLGAWATLPAVIGGYIGNPFTPQPWIVDAMAVGIRQNRWPTNALVLSSTGSTSSNNDNTTDQSTDDTDTIVLQNNFDTLPIVGSWKRRPLELATLRLQSMMGISLAHWKELAPDQYALDSGVLTQLGGCLIVNKGNEVLYEWKDPGICAVANFEDILKKI